MISAVLIAGFAGGMVRGLVGFVKHQFAFKDVDFELPYFMAMILISGVVGFTIVSALKGLDVSVLGRPLGPALGFIAGYAGGDLIENLYKIIFKTDTFFGFGDH